MDSKASDLCGRQVEATDGAVGQVDDLYLDDGQWGVRYLVVRTGGWLSLRPVLLSPHSLAAEPDASGPLRVRLTREQVRNAPPASTDLPVSRLYEAALADYFRYPYYWGGPFLWGGLTAPAQTVRMADPASGNDELRNAALRGAAESHLRSFREIVGYTVHARDGDAGDVQDLLVDTQTWGVRSLVVDTRRWWPGGLVAVSPRAASRVDWAGRRIELAMLRDQVKEATAA